MVYCKYIYRNHLILIPLSDIRKTVAVQTQIIDLFEFEQGYDVIACAQNEIIKSFGVKDQLISGIALEYLGDQTDQLIAAIRKANAQPWIPVALISNNTHYEAIGCKFFTENQSAEVARFLREYYRPKILIIEDEEHLQDILQQALGKTYDITLASDGSKGFELASSGEFDLVLTDHNLPGMNGATVIENLNKTGVSVPIILMTAFNEKELELASLSLGASEYLAKPVSIKVLRKSIIDVLLTHQNVARYVSDSQLKDTESWGAWHSSLKERLS